jgi:hypothetical protein
MKKLRCESERHFCRDYSEKKVCGQTGYSFDFYIGEEETVVEISLGLNNPNSEFERDILKCLLAQEAGTRIKKLVFICKAPGRAQKDWRGPAAIIEFMMRRFQIEVSVMPIVDVNSGTGWPDDIAPHQNGSVPY